MQVAFGFSSCLHASLRAAAFSFLGLVAATGLVTPAAAEVVLGSGAGVQVTGADMRAATIGVPDAARPSLLAIKENVEKQAEGLFLRRRLAAEAQQAGLDKNPEIQEQLLLIRERILSDARMAAFDKANTPDDATLEAYAQSAYKADPKRFERGAQTRVRHILIKNDGPEAKAKAEALLAQLKAGASFEKLATEKSFDLATAPKGGDLGFFAPGTMVKEFDEAVAQLKNPGDLSGVVKTQFGYHLIKLEERRSAGIAPYAEVREALRAEASARAQRDAREKLITKMLAEFKPDAAAIEAFTQQYRSK
jgi:peptidyl-prolyl cis-trans isomerase C